MLLKKVTIDNFRSIEHLEINVLGIAGCKLHTFFGINETGKSNILKAIALLNPTSLVKYEYDCNKNASKHNKAISLKFTFKVEPEDNLPKKLEFLGLKSSTPAILKIPEIEKIIEFNEKSDRNEYYLLRFFNKMKKVVDTNGNTKTINASLYETAVSATDIVKRDDIEKCIDLEAKNILDNAIPEVIFWEASDAYLIVNQINLQQFKLNPESSIPLKHIFFLAGYTKEEITKNIERIQSNGDTRAEFEDILSECITKHINKVWPEHAINIKVRLENNDFCEIYVEDKGNQRQRFNMKQRSDGFKQFVSILLSISIENATNQLRNKVILLDEPERSLHPGSIKCLRDELLRISEKNVVFASSHSIYMVDKKNLNRHYTVTKDEGKTIVEQVSTDNPIQDEVIYNALGTSIFELIEPNMLIFEGRSDKDLFDTFTNKFRDELQPSSILTISATGTKPIPHYVKFFHNKFVNGFVVVDSDKDGRDAISAICQQDAEFKESLFELKHLVDIDKQEITLEDLLPEELILSCAKELYKIDFESAHEEPILNYIKSLKVRNSIHTDGKLEELKKLVINRVLSHVKNKDKDMLKNEYPLYYSFLTNLHSKIKEVN